MKFKYNNWLGQGLEQSTRDNVEKMKSLIDNWNLMGVQKGKLLALNSEGWEDRKKTYPESYVCNYCGESTLESNWEKIGAGFSHKICIEQNEEKIKQKLGPLSQIPFGYTEEGELEHRTPVTEEVDLEPSLPVMSLKYPGYFNIDEREKELKLIEEQKRVGGLKGQFQQSPIDPGVERCEYTYESHDDGKTIYRRKHGTKDKELVEDWDSEVMTVIR